MTSVATHGGLTDFQQGDWSNFTELVELRCVWGSGPLRLTSALEVELQFRDVVFPNRVLRLFLWGVISVHLPNLLKHDSKQKAFA